MSRIGRKPIAVPDAVQVGISNGTIEVKGPKGTLSYSVPRKITVEHDQELKCLVLKRESNDRTSRAMHGLARALVNNMVTGVTDGFTKELEVVGVGYSAKVQGKKLSVTVGYTNPVEFDIPEGVSVADPKTTNVSMPGIGSVPVTLISINGSDRQVVGQFAATVRSCRPPEPYKGKGIRYRGEEVRRKAGKAMAGGD